MNDVLDTLPGTLDAVWRRLEAALHDPAAPARTLALATAGTTGGAEARIVVLRGADRPAGTLTLFTHARSGKVTEIARDPSGTLLLWDPASRLQARLSCTLRAGPGSASAWQALPPRDRQLYASGPLPGDPLDDPGDREAATPDPALFAAIIARIGRIETLHLGRDLHRRARFAREAGWRAQWIAP